MGHHWERRRSRRVGSPGPVLRPARRGNVFIGRDVPRYPPGNSVVSSLKDAGYLDPDRRDWRLRPDSRFKGAAGGRDPGAEIEALVQTEQVARR